MTPLPQSGLLQEWHCDTDVANGNHVPSHKCFLLGCMVSIRSQITRASLQFPPAATAVLLWVGQCSSLCLIWLQESCTWGTQGYKDCLVIQRCRSFILATFSSHNTETKLKLTDTSVLESFMSPWLRLKTPERREPQLWECLHKMCLLASL